MQVPEKNNKVDYLLKKYSKIKVTENKMTDIKREREEIMTNNTGIKQVISYYENFMTKI